MEMEYWLGLANEILEHNVSVHIYSLPHFTMESFLAVLLCIIFVLLHFEISNISLMTLKLKPLVPNTVSLYHFKNRKPSQDSCTSTKMSTVTRDDTSCEQSTSNQSALEKISKTISNAYLGWVVPRNFYHSYQCFVIEPEYVHSVYNLTPKEYVKREKERKRHENELKQLLKSLHSHTVLIK